jgi:transcriptional regulator with XRE-family HTH domain
MKIEIMKKLSHLIICHRKKNRITRKKLSDDCQKHPLTIKRLETGVAEDTQLGVIFLLAKAFGLKPSELVAHLFDRATDPKVSEKNLYELKKMINQNAYTENLICETLNEFANFLKSSNF